MFEIDGYKMLKIAKKVKEKKGYVYEMLLKGTRKKNPKIEWIYDRLVELKNELNKALEEAREAYKIILYDKETRSRFEKEVMPLRLIKFMFYRKYVTLDESTVKRVMYLHRMLVHYARKVKIPNERVIVPYKREASLKLGFSERYIETFAYNHPQLFAMVKGDCQNADCFVRRYKEFIKMMTDNIDWILDNWKHLTKKEKEEVTICSGYKITQKYLIPKYLRTMPLTLGKRFYKVIRIRKCIERILDESEV